MPISLFPFHYLTALDYREDALPSLREAIELRPQLANDQSAIYNADYAVSFRTIVCQL
jgi:hypothetical protein